MAYCPIALGLYDKLADSFMNLETGEDWPTEMLEEKEKAGLQARHDLGEHLETCVQCSMEEFRIHKKPAASVG